MAPAGRMPTVFVTHGGGPLPLLGDPMHKELVAALRQLPARLPQPRAIVVVTAHWEEPKPRVIATPSPGMLYDYYGFPPESYKLQYTAPGSPEVGARVVELLRAAGFDAAVDATGRGFDHGVFVPLMLAYPDGDVPVVPLSILSSMSPEEHARMGRALAPLRNEGTLILASGSSYHNIPAMMGSLRGGNGGGLVGQAFDDWLAHAATALTGEARDAALARWEQAPGARAAHPREDHLVPLFVAAAAAGDSRGTAQRMRLAGVAASGFVFGDEV